MNRREERNCKSITKFTYFAVVPTASMGIPSDLRTEFDNQRCCRHRRCQLCSPGIQPGGTQNPGLRSSWSSREHRQSDHPGPYYGMRKARCTDILMICDDLTQPEGIVMSAAKLNDQFAVFTGQATTAW